MFITDSLNLRFFEIHKDINENHKKTKTLWLKGIQNEEILILIIIKIVKIQVTMTLIIVRPKIYYYNINL